MTPANWFAVKPLPVTDDRHVMPPTPSVAQEPERVQTNATIEVVLAVRGLTMTAHWPLAEGQALVRWTRELLA